MQGKILPMRRVFDQQAQGITNLLFDIEANPNPKTGQADIKMLFKNVGGIQLSEMQEGTYITWGEYRYKEQEFVVTQDYNAPTNTIEIGVVDNTGATPTYTPTLGNDVNGNPLILPGSVLQIIQRDPTDPADDCCANLVQKMVISTDPINHTVTLEAGSNPAGFTFTQGDRVRKLYHTRNDCDLITNTFDIIPNTSYHSYIQHFDYRIEFSTQEINTAYTVGSRAQTLNKIYHGNLSMVRSIANAAMFGRNRAMNGAQKGETMGLWNEIMKNSAIDPTIIADVSSALSDNDVVKVLVHQIMMAQDSGYINQGDEMVILCNQVAIHALQKLQSAFNYQTGFTVNTNDQFRKRFGLPIVETNMGTVEYMTDRVLSDTFKHEGVAIIMPKKSMAVRSRKYREVDPSMNGGLIKREIGFEMIDVTDNKQHECREYDVKTDLNIMVMGADSGAIRVVKGIKNCM